jgi:hypothetical protein
MHKLEQDDIDTTFEYAIRTLSDKKDIETLLGLLFNTTEKTKRMLLMKMK